MDKIILILSVVALIGCSNSKIITLATQGELSKKEYNEEVPLHYLNKHIFIDVEINNKIYTFLFDTGWDITHIDKSLLDEVEFSPLKKYKTTGSSFEDQKIQYGFLSTLTIGSINFQNIGVGLQDLSFIKSPFPDRRKIYGVIGTNIMRKGAWQIVYNQNILKFSNRIENFSSRTDAYKIPMIPKNSSNWGLNRIKLTINGVTDNFIFDTGSYSNFTANYQFLERLKKNKTQLKEITIDQPDKRRFEVNELEVSTLKVKNQELNIEKEIDLLIGNSFLENYVVTVDWVNNELYLKSIEK